jgi:hypothetical protein
MARLSTVSGPPERTGGLEMPAEGDGFSSEVADTSGRLHALI